MRIDIDSCEEILITITRNKTRSLLTAFGVFWGIFMLVALIGGGQGMQQAMSSQFEGFATNSAFLVSQIRQSIKAKLTGTFYQYNF
ncbi:ABC transporter permease, partial [Bacteroides intestinalis]|uniref:ABC transporter permease n=1 Tax=Bacteroides intestinalis TaxID=329854 RepID=UPI001EDB98AE